MLTQVTSRSGFKGRWAVVARSFSPRTVVADRGRDGLQAGPGGLRGARGRRPGRPAPRGLGVHPPVRGAVLRRPADRGQPGLCGHRLPAARAHRGDGAPDMVLLTFAFVSGFAGILLSPAHLCLALTAEYFKADMRKVYRILVWPVAAVFAVALLELLIFRIL
ncbi:MAG: DUF401 family protein [Candidatus Moduliflexus flocculans]|nr:DUF401 family protein [Candidatus Moduliflexus flocculans]